MKNIAILTLLSLLFTACSSTIGNKSDPTKAVFRYGVTSKSQVAESLGLPANVNYSPDNMQEAWVYQKSTTLKGIEFVTPTGIGNPNPFYDVKMFFKGGKLPKNTAVIYVFDNQGILSSVQKP